MKPSRPRALRSRRRALRAAREPLADVPETDVRARSPAATWASSIRSPPARRWTARRARRRLDDGLHVALPVLPQPRHLDDDQRHPGDDRAGAEELRKYRHGLKVMSGGFTLSGGEPLMQHRFAVKLLTGARRRWGSTRARDQRLLRRPPDGDETARRSISCCSTSRPGIPSAIERSPAWTSGRRSSSRGGWRPRRPIWVRFVLVPGLTDDPDDIAQIARFAAGLGNVERVDVLPFHQMGRASGWASPTRWRRRAAVDLDWKSSGGS